MIDKEEITQPQENTLDKTLLSNEEQERILRSLDHTIENLETSTYTYPTIISRYEARRHMPDFDPEHLQALRRSKAMADKQLDVLLQYRRTAQGGKAPDYDPEPTGLINSIQCAVKIYKPLLKDKDIEINPPTLDLDKGDKEFYFIGDRHRMTQVMIELFSNMMDFLEDMHEPRIDIEIEEFMKQSNGTGRRYVRMIVKNNGPEIPYENTDFLFEDTTSTRSCPTNKHKGVGLNTCRNIIEGKFGGKIYLENIKQVKQGQTGVLFRVELPIFDYEQL